MYRFWLLFVLMLSCTTLFSAPVPVDKEAKQKELEKLWADLSKGEPVASKALLKLFKQPEQTVPFLKIKLQPLRLDADRCRKLLKDLGDEDEKVWKAAWDEFQYQDPRLVIDLVTLMDEIKEKPARTRMVDIFSDSKADSHAGQDIKIFAVNDGYNFRSDNTSWWAEHKIERICGEQWGKRSWMVAVRAVVLLEEFNTPEAVIVLEQMAEGHPEAHPTKTAKEALERMKAK
jgi:hypothetical protein